MMLLCRLSWLLGRGGGGWLEGRERMVGEIVGGEGAENGKEEDEWWEEEDSVKR